MAPHQVTKEPSRNFGAFFFTVKKKALSLQPKSISKPFVMKKKSLILLALLAFTVGSAKAQWFDFTNNVRASVGLNLGSVGYQLGRNGLNTDLANFGWGVSLSVGGVYLDFIYQGPEHRNSNEVGVADWHDHTALTINAGYQIPVLSWLFVTPIVGYSNETTGLTLANSVTADHSKIVHKYVQEHIYPHFNYGAGLMFRPIPWIEIGAVATTHAIYGNISFSAGKY